MAFVLLLLPEPVPGLLLVLELLSCRFRFLFYLFRKCFCQTVIIESSSMSYKQFMKHLLKLFLGNIFRTS